MRKPGLLIAAGAILAAMPALAADPHRLAYSEKMGVEVFAQPDATGAWCRPALGLSLMLKDNSPLLQGGIADFLPKLAPVLAQECPAAASLSATAYKAADRTQVAAYTATRAGNWAPSPVAAATPADAPPVTVAPPAPVAAQSVRDLADPVGYWPLMVRYAKENPAAADHAATLKAYASTTDCRNYTTVANNEFRLNDYLAKTRTGLLSEPVKPYVRFTLNTRFGQYDQASGAFAFTPLTDEVHWDQPYAYCGGFGYFDSVVKRISGGWAAGKSIFGLPATLGEAEALVDHINRRRYGNREVYLELIAKPVFEPATPDHVAHVTFELIEATAYLDRDSAKVIHSYSTEELTSAAKARQDALAAIAETKRKAEEEQARQRAALQQRYQAEADMRMLRGATKATRIAYFHNGGHGLSSISATTGRSLIENRPQPAIFMVKAGGSGARDVEAAWPGRLRLDLSPGLPELVKGQWYVVSGDVTVENPDKSDGKPLVGRMAVRAASGCRQDACGDADDIAGSIRKRYPDLPVQTGSIQ